MSPATGRLSSFSISLGQSLTTGQSIGKVDLMGGYKLVAKIDEYYINKLHAGLKEPWKVMGKNIMLLYPKYCQVVQGQFSAELNFADNNKPDDLKIGMTFGVKLKLSADTQSLMIPKGNFFKDTNGKWIFVTENGKAVRKNISLGRENPLYYEVLSGLKEESRLLYRIILITKNTKY
jgi:HlyD family secretion protein